MELAPTSRGLLNSVFRISRQRSCSDCVNSFSLKYTHIRAVLTLNVPISYGIYESSNSAGGLERGVIFEATDMLALNTTAQSYRGAKLSAGKRNAVMSVITTMEYET